MANALRCFTWNPQEAAWQDGIGRASLVLPYTDFTLADATLSRLAPLIAGIDAAVDVVAVQTTPYPAPMGSAIPAYAYLAEQLSGLSERHAVDLHLKIVLARYWDEGFRAALKPDSTVLIGTWRRPWPTREVRLARALLKEGRDVALWRLDRRRSSRGADCTIRAGFAPGQRGHHLHV